MAPCFPSKDKGKRCSCHNERDGDTPGDEMVHHSITTGDSGLNSAMEVGVERKRSIRRVKEADWFKPNVAGATKLVLPSQSDSGAWSPTPRDQVERESDVSKEQTRIKFHPQLIKPPHPPWR